MKMHILPLVLAILSLFACNPDSARQAQNPDPVNSNPIRSDGNQQVTLGLKPLASPLAQVPLNIDKDTFTRYGYLDYAGDLADPVKDLVTFTFDANGLIQSGSNEYFNEPTPTDPTSSSIVARTYSEGRYRYVFLNGLRLSTWVLDLDIEKGVAVMTRDNGTITRFHVKYSPGIAEVFYDDSERWMMHFEKDAFSYRYGYAVLGTDGKTQNDGESRYDFTRKDGVIRSVRTSTGEPEPTEIHFSKLDHDSRLFINDMGGISRMAFRLTPCNIKADPLILALNMEISESLRAEATIYFMPYLPGFWDPPN